MMQLTRADSIQLDRSPLGNEFRAVLAEHEHELARPFCKEIHTTYTLEREETTLFGLVRLKAQYGFTIRSKNG